MTKKWNVLGEIKGKKDRQKEVIETLLKNRGITAKKQIDEFFSPREPSELTLLELGISKTEVDNGLKRIKKAIKNKEKIIVYSDYDADGICGAAILWETLHKMGAYVFPYVPHREKEGYGLSKMGINNILSDPFYTKEKKSTLIITVDHGIVANKEVDFAKQKGIDTIIIDHHQKNKKDPKATAIIHTTKLCGAGAAWIFMRKLDGRKEIQLDLAALATIADLVPLTGANRSFVKHGLDAINKTERIGLNAIIEEAGIQKGNIGTYEVGFIIGPRLNAMGRMVHGLDALRLLCTNNGDKAKSLAHTLGSTNRERQLLTEEIISHAKQEVMKNAKKDEEKLIFLAHETYNQGVIGLVAGRLVEEFYKPTIIIAKGEIYSKASARSIRGVNIIETIRQSADILVNCGGHPMAAGFTVENKFLEILKEKLLKIAEKEITDDKLERKLFIDCELQTYDITLEFYNEILKFAPYGIENPEPVFTIKNLTVQNYQLMGSEGKHLKLWVTDDKGKVFEAVFFGGGKRKEEIVKAKTIDLAFIISLNSWNGREKLQLKIKDMKAIL